MLLHAHGEDVLRVKGLLNVRDMPAPVVIHGVQHVIHPPVHLDRWPDADRRSRIVFIVRDLEQAVIEASLAAFSRLGEAEKRAA
jgi:G3E family GTPase